MPDVYDDLYLSIDSIKTWNQESHNPDLVSICLGQNDFSDGEGPKPRAELDSTDYVEDYIGFLKKIRKQYPDWKNKNQPSKENYRIYWPIMMK